MLIERHGRTYELITMSQPDCRSLELNEVTGGRTRTLLLGKLTEDGRYHFLSLVHRGRPADEPLFLPLELVEEFVSLMKERL